MAGSGLYKLHPRTDEMSVTLPDASPPGRTECSDKPKKPPLNEQGL
jgi:hypothetical protein